MSNSVRVEDVEQRNEDAGRRLADLAVARVKKGFAPPAEIYRVKNRNQIDWSLLSEWARPVDPEIFDGCCHEG